MKSLLKSNKFINIISFIFIGFIFSLFLLPSFSLSARLPDIRLEDFFAALMLLFICLILFYKKLNLDLKIKKYIWFSAFFIIWIGITMIGNGLATRINCYFEFYKIFKFFIILIFFYTIRKHAILFLNPYEVILKLFYFVMVLNILQYFNILNFNHWIMPFYTTEFHLSKFGLDSIGRPSAKRMLGVMGNPNTNAIIMAFFSVIFLTQIKKLNKSKLLSRAGRINSKKNIHNIILFFASLMLILMTQSRTVVVGVIVISVLYWILLERKMQLLSFFKKVPSFFNKKNLSFYVKKHLVQIFFIFIGFIILMVLLDFSYFSNLWSVKWSQNLSITGRLKIWDYLINMVNQSPFIGYGPNKDYFYQHKIYSESEYVLMAWRYGYIGIVFYLTWVLLPVYTAIKDKTLISSKNVILFSVIILVSAFTNNPMAEARIMALYAMISGIMYADYAVAHRDIRGITNEKDFAGRA